MVCRAIGIAEAFCSVRVIEQDIILHLCHTAIRYGGVAVFRDNAGHIRLVRYFNLFHNPNNYTIMRKSTFLQFAVICLFVIIAVGSSKSSNPISSSSSWDGSTGQQVLQHVVQASNGGRYVGNASSEAQAKSMAAKAGYSAYNYYPATGEVFGS